MFVLAVKILTSRDASARERARRRARAAATDLVYRSHTAWKYHSNHYIKINLNKFDMLQ